MVSPHRVENLLLGDQKEIFAITTGCGHMEGHDIQVDTQCVRGIKMV
jgi:hypothetical protein